MIRYVLMLSACLLLGCSSAEPPAVVPNGAESVEDDPFYCPHCKKKHPLPHCIEGMEDADTLPPSLPQ